MKITDITVRIELSPNDNPELVRPVVIVRKDKQWSVIQDGTPRGMFPGEVALIHMINTDIIHKYNSNIKDK